MTGLLSEVVSLAAVILAALAGLFAWGRAKKRQGARERDRRAEEDDHAKADDIRDRVDRDLDRRLRRYDDAGWRD